MALTDDPILNALSDLELYGEELRTLPFMIEEKVNELRSAGVPWASIAAALGVSTQAAWSRWRHVEDQDQASADAT